MIVDCVATRQYTQWKAAHKEVTVPLIAAVLVAGPVDIPDWPAARNGYSRYQLPSDFFTSH
jgi:hypothetical protein